MACAGCAGGGPRPATNASCSRGDPKDDPPRRSRTSRAGAYRFQTPPQRRSHTLRNLALVAVAIAAVIVAAILLSGPSPKDSLEKAGAAFAHQDAQAFDNYVDVQSILGDWTDQAASSWLANNNGSAGDALIANGLVAGFKSLFVPKIASSVEQELLGNRTSDQPQSNDSDATTNYMASFLSSGIHSLITSQLKYQGSRPKQSPVPMLFSTCGCVTSQQQPLIVQVRMRLAGDHWRIVAIPDVAGIAGAIASGAMNGATGYRRLEITMPFAKPVVVL